MFVDQKYFVDDGKNIVFKGPYMEAYISKYYFDKEIASLIGDHFSVLGVFNFITFNKQDGTYPNHIRTMNIPTIFFTYPSDYETRKIDLFKDGNEEEYTVFKYYSGDIICRNVVTQNKKVFEKFLNILMQGKLPKSIAYTDVIKIWMKNFELNGVKFDIPRVIYELIVSKIYRNKNKPEETFAKVIGKNPNVSPYDYITASPREITGYSSNFAGIMFEDMDSQLTNAMTSTKLNKKEMPSPMEDILKY